MYLFDHMLKCKKCSGKLRLFIIRQAPNLLIN